MKNIICLSILFSCLFSGCFSLYPENFSHGKNGFVRSENHLPNWNKILIYFEDEYLIGKTYKEVAFLRIQGSEVNAKQEVIEMFKKEASRFRADAVIDVNVELIEKENDSSSIQDDCEPYAENEKYKVFEIIGTAIVFAAKEI